MIGALAAAAELADDPDDVVALTTAAAGDDPLVAMGAIHALAASPDPAAGRTLATLLEADETWRREHAAWAIGGHAPGPAATARLVAMAGAGGFGGMLAQVSLSRQALRPGGELRGPVLAALRDADAPQVRARLVETLALDPAHEVTGVLTTTALDASGEHSVARAAAVAGLGDRGDSGSRATLVRLAASADEQVAPHAVLALFDASPQRAPAPAAAGGIAIAQIFLHADLDPGLTRAGMGDNGGIASLLVHLGEALAAAPEVTRVLTLCRGAGTDALADALWPREEGASFGAVPMPPAPMRDAWEHRVVVERGIRRQLRAQGPFDVLHLRMGDVGTLAASRVARELGLPVVFTAAPDPHAALDGLGEVSGAAREALGERDALDHWWFRARLVERLTRESAGVAVMPRTDAMREIPRLLGVDPAGFAARAAVIPEAVHAGTLRRARADARRPAPHAPQVLRDLQRMIGMMPPERHDLPLLVSVGRLAAVKGMERIVAAWAGDPGLREAMNLVIVGGDLDAPSPEERETIAAIEAALTAGPEGACDPVMLGHRPHLDAMRVLAHAAGDGGVYVCGSAKEEYGLAIVEALGAGLVAVAPRAGGPATYIDDGRTGVLVDATRVEEIRAGIHRARRLATIPGRAGTVRGTVLGEMTIERMADRLVELYLRLAPGVAVGAGSAAGA